MEEEYIQFAQKALIIKDNKLLIIRKSNKDKANFNLWEVPGGRKIIGETLDEQIIREVKEEVSLNIIPGQIFDMWQFKINVNNKETTIVAVARFCKLINEKINITEDVFSGYKWAEIDNSLLEYNFIPGIRNTIKKLVETYSTKN